MADGGTVGPTRYTFGTNQGLRLTGGLVDTSNYSVAIRMEYDSMSPTWKKVIDFRSRSSDNGLYVQGDKLTLFPDRAGGPTALVANTDFVVVLTRDTWTGETKGYINGILQWTFTGSTGAVAVPPNNVLTFFEDDFATGANEAQAGSVDCIAVYDGVLTAAEVADLAAGEDCESSPDTVTISYSDFCDISDFTLSGSALYPISNPVNFNGCVLRLTDRLSQTGGAFLTDSISLQNDVSFSTAFRFQITDPQGSSDGVQGADGLVFVVQTTGNQIGGAGGGLGYSGLANSLGIEFDTWNNGSIDGDNGNHVGIDLNGSINSVARANVATTLNNGAIWTAWVDYDGDNELLEVRLSDTGTRPASPLLSYDVDLPATLGTTETFFGFTSGTGGAANDHDIRSWELTTEFDPIQEPPGVPPDTTPPVVTVPADFTEEATSADGAEVTFSASAEDDVDGTVAVSCTPESGEIFPLGDTEVECTAEDAAENEGSASFTVTVVDTTDPVVTAPDDVVAEATGPLGALVSYSGESATDAVGVVSLVCLPASGTQFAIGDTLVVCTAEDAAENEGSASFTVTVEDTTGPDITDVSADPSELWAPNNKMRSVTVSVTATDAVDPNPSCVITGVSDNETDEADDWEQTGDLTVDLRAQRDGGGNGRTYTISVTCTDGEGNNSDGTVEVTVAHDQGNGKAKGRNK